MSLSNPFSEDSRYQYSFKLIATVTAAQDLHKIKPDNIPTWRMGKRHKNPTLTQSSNPYLLEKRKSVFPSRVSLGISITFQGRLQAQKYLASTKTDSIVSVWMLSVLFWHILVLLVFVLLLFLIYFLFWEWARS